MPRDVDDLRKDELLSDLRRFLQARPEVRLAYLFGSRATGVAHAGSDVDVAVLLAPSARGAPGWGSEAGLAAALMAMLGTSRVDLLELSRAPVVLRNRVAREGIELVARSDREAVVFLESAIRDYLDTAPLRRIATEAVRAGCAKAVAPE